ncbi:uroporphyrin-III C-methyltransferase/precorrin-2 dehydrogenase/sirohydrochlorin ferrochelatase [Nocardioides daedukensis]|uniref:uroporphyrinogen-III C-methyltransferase n=1 Tax=Nocardioides daedukensis TaxID=634462 RepID=A0A7Y9UMP2_9ACTN|nr:uroporphyrinogen-III C-methyltransferase [Nocardioides daedukensis]NYG57703.1 uroporphyrin-III C-methyltransferase/precorrin-2 dehydrogenase/sirohydrochlorin ferrochelatase [Nocardioides daedukensis]
MSDFVPYPSGLRLAGRKVVVVGGGHVAQRRVPALIAAGADILLVSRAVTPSIEGLANEITIELREFTPADLDEAWYAIAATDDRETNAAVAAAAEERRIFCVRSDDAREASAWTPATGRHGTVTVAVLGDREPRQSATIRDEIMTALREGVITSTPDRTPGVVLVGGGPGSPDLVTIAARNALSSADVVVADRLAPRELLDELSPDTELIDVAKLPRGRSATQEFINEVIVERAKQGKRVVRFKGGDNFVFGRGYEEVIACRAAGVPVEVIPGLSSSISVPARAGIPVTHRGVTHEFSVISGHLPPGHAESLVNWSAVAQMQGTVVLLMAVQTAASIAAALVEHGRDPATPVAIVMDGTMPEERTVLTTLATIEADIAANDVRPPAIIVIGEVVAVAHPERFPRG